MYGLKGVAAYAVHARTLGQEDEEGKTVITGFARNAVMGMQAKSLRP